MSDTRLRLISWNIGGRVKVNPQQMEKLNERGPDLLALQEVRFSALNHIKPRLADMELPHFVESAHIAAKHDRSYGVLIASRWPLQEMHFTDVNAPFPERLISALVDTPWGPIELHTVHIVPGISNGYKKIEMFEDIYIRLAHHPKVPRILCGDFNTPQEETPKGRVITWGEKIRSDGRVEIPQGDERWDAGERSILQGLAPFDLSDVFRGLNCYEVEAYSWFHKTRYGVTQRRFDHIFASQALNPIECRYLPLFVEAELSDHAAIEAVFQPL
jgi:exonuclease III